MNLKIGSVTPGLILCIVITACGTTENILDEESTDVGTDTSDSTPSTDGDVDTDVDSDSDSDTDADADTDTDTDTDGDSDTDTDTDTDVDSDTDGDGDTDTDTDSDADGDGDSDTDGDGDTDTEINQDTGSDTDTVPPVKNSECKVPEDEFGAIDDCTEVAPPESFEPEVQWEWWGEYSPVNVRVTPLVANLTDDNDDGEIDLCDIPDVVVIDARGIHVLDGATGTEHYHAVVDVDAYTDPALGDIDGDGVPEIVVMGRGEKIYPIAVEHDGTIKWTGDSIDYIFETYKGNSSVALADIDEDGDVEIIAWDSVFDHEGNLLWTAPTDYDGDSPTAANLDGEPGLEILIGPAAYYADGSLYYLNDEVRRPDGAYYSAFGGYTQVADLDDDGLPEVLFTNAKGVAILEHDGTTKLQAYLPEDTDDWLTALELNARDWWHPTCIHDFDGDREVEFSINAYAQFSLYERDTSVLWRVPKPVNWGSEAATAFDFLGDGSAEALFSTSEAMHVFDGNGETVFEIPLAGGDTHTYPVVADVDNDGSAEIIVVAMKYEGRPPVQVIRDKEDRWIQARRIWNQQTYHVTNVREDGTIPRVEPKSWELFNTFRTNIQIENGTLCRTIPVI